MWLPLAPFERDGVRAALKRGGLPFEDVDAPGRWFWRFEENDVPVGFGGIEVHGDTGFLRLVTLPVVRHQGLGGAMAAALEGEAVALGCSTLYVLPCADAPFFAAHGFAPCPSDAVPVAVATHAAAQPSATVMMKRLD